MKDRREDGWRWTVQLGFVSLAAFAVASFAVGCPPEVPEDTCKKDSDCFEGEICVDGACVVGPTDDAGDTSGMEVASITVQRDQAEVDVGSKVRFAATVEDADGDDVTDEVVDRIEWSTGDTSVASVSPDSNDPSVGVVTGEAKGSTQVTATVGETEGSAQVNVVEGAGNNPPVADAGDDQTVVVGTQVQLDGSDSMDPDGDPLDFNWSFQNQPSGSSASLSDPTAEQPTFTADAVGDFDIELTVDDGQATQTDQVTVTAQPMGGDTDVGMDTGDVGPDAADTGMDADVTGDTQQDTTGDTQQDTGPDGGDTTMIDSGQDASMDSGSMDTGSTDTSSSDTGGTDTASMDSGTMDSGTMDSGTMDSGTMDSGTMDSSSSDSGTADSSTSDSSSSDTSSDTSNTSGDTSDT